MYGENACVHEYDDLLELSELQADHQPFLGGELRPRPSSIKSHTAMSEEDDVPEFPLAALLGGGDARVGQIAMGALPHC
jgi:hypothetical protein